jgi:competence protein ComEC
VIGVGQLRWRKHAVRAIAGTSAWLSARLEAERDRWLLWLPVALGAGIAVYFELPAEPPLWLGLAGTGIGLLSLFFRVFRHELRPLTVAVVTVAIGFTAATWRTAEVGAPVLARPYGPAAVEGRVVEVTLLPEGRRIVLDQVLLRGVAPEETPARVRVSLRRGIGAAIATGDRITVVARLSPPPGPAAPGAFDFQRFAWYVRIGAVGYTRAMPSVVQAGEPSDPVMRIDELRRRLTARIVAALPGDPGAMAAAMITGDQTGISRDAMQAMRDSGLAHLLSISGLHITFAAVLVMGLVRYGLAAVPWLSLRYPVKKWAAGAGVASAFFYTLLAGAPVPAQRSFLMLAIVLLAVLVDRTALTMRMVCWAAVVILLVLPESLTGASFQLSFAAVVALIAAWEASQPWRARHAGRAPTLVGRVLDHLGASLFTTLVASIATAGFSAYHFNRLSLVGAFANLIAVPLTGIWVIPWGLLALVLLPFGVEHLALGPMGWGTGAIIAIAHHAAAWPAAATLTHTLPGISLWLMTFGGLWLCLWRTRWRLAGVIPIVAAFLLGSFHPPPDILVSGNARLVGVRTADGGMLLSSGRTERFTGESWVRRAGAETAGPWPMGMDSVDGRLRCDAVGCLYRRGGQRIAIASKVEALVDDCAAADVLLSLVPVRRRCASPRHVIDRFDLWRNGAYALWLRDDGSVSIENARDARGERPWVPKPERRPRRAAPNDGREVSVRPGAHK